MSLLLLEHLQHLYLSWETREGQRYVCIQSLSVSADEWVLQRKANGVEVSLDASELEGLSEEELRRKYEQHSRGSAGVAGSKEDFSDMVAKEMAKKKQKMEKEREMKKGKEYRF